MPASGPFGPLTTPPRSLSPMVICGGTLCCACDGAGDNVAAAMAAALKYRLVVRIIGALLVRSCALVITAQLRSGSRAGEATQPSVRASYPCTVHCRPQRHRRLAPMPVAGSNRVAFGFLTPNE